MAHPTTRSRSAFRLLPAGGGFGAGLDPKAVNAYILELTGTGTAGRVNRPLTGGSPVAFVLWIIAVVLVVAGIIALLRRQILYGIVLIIVGLLVGPGGVSIFT